MTGKHPPSLAIARLLSGEEDNQTSTEVGRVVLRRVLVAPTSESSLVLVVAVSTVTRIEGIECYKLLTLRGVRGRAKR